MKKVVADGVLQSIDIPAEIWSIILHIVFGSKLFGWEERYTYTRLRSVCASWRRILISALGICSGLELDLGVWANGSEGLEGFKERLAPWLAIIAPNRPYRLQLSLKRLGSLESDLCTSIVRHLLCEAVPTPTSLSFDSFDVCDAICQMGKACNTVTDLDANLWGRSRNYDAFGLPDQFPMLESFTSAAFVRIQLLSSHRNLQSLTLLDIAGASQDFALLCVELPCLRQVKIACGVTDMFNWTTAVVALDAPVVHSTLDVVLIEGEQLLAALEYLTLPSLKFLGIEQHERPEGRWELEELLPAFFKRSGVSNITVSLKGCCHTTFFATLTGSLPPSTTLLTTFHFDYQAEEEEEEQDINLISPYADYGNIKEIVCLNLRWIRGIQYKAMSQEERRVKISAPEEALRDDKAGLLESMIAKKGCVVETHTRGVIDGIISSLVPQMANLWELE
jgi:hypothetical protein